MLRIVTIALVLSALALVVDLRPAHAISRNNPFRSFNVTGVNYGSMQWEQSHRRSTSTWHGRRVFLRRR